MTMTLGQVRDWHRGWLAVFPVSGTAHKAMADAIDAHMAGMGEPVAHFIETSQGNWEQAADMFRGQPGVRPLYADPPIDLAAVHEVIEELNGYCEASDESCYGTLSTTLVRSYMDKLEAAMPKEAK